MEVEKEDTRGRAGAVWSALKTSGSTYANLLHQELHEKYNKWGKEGY